MYVLNVLEIIPAVGGANSFYCAVASDDCYIYLVDQKRPVISQFNMQMNHVRNIPVCRGYEQLCYDCHEHCYWAWTKKCEQTIYKLDRCFREIDAITLKKAWDCAGRIKSIAYCAESKRIILNYGGYATALNKFTHREEKCFESKEEDIQAMCKACKLYVCGESRKECSNVSGYCQDGGLRLHCCLPSGFTLKAVTAPCAKHHCHEEIQLYILACKNACYSYVLKCSICPCGGEAGYDCGCSRHHRHNDKRACGGCTDGRQHNHCCHCQCDCSHDYHGDDWQHCDCGHSYGHHDDNCHQCGSSRHCDHNHHSHSDIEQSCSDIILSVALMETALSHILNAEGEKIQKILADAETTDEIMAVNQSVKETITKITHLEQVLYAKLDLISGVYAGSKKTPEDGGCETNG